MYCPHIGDTCNEACVFYSDGKCLQAEYYKYYIKSSEQTMAAFKNIFGGIVNRDDLPENIKQEIEEMLKKYGFG